MEQTKFATVYDRFLGKITDDMYMEMTPQDTIRDLQNLLLNSIPNFEFPRKNLYQYQILTEVIDEADVQPGDFIIGVVWAELPEETDPPPQVIIEKSHFLCELTDRNRQRYSKVILAFYGLGDKIFAYFIVNARFFCLN